MKKKNVIIEILIVLLILLTCFAVYDKAHKESDVFFSIALGNRVLEHGFEEEDEIILHDGVKSSYLRWGFEIIVSSLYKIGGFKFVYIFSLILVCMQGLIYYSLLRTFTKNRFLSVIMTCAIMHAVRSELSSRAHLVSFILFMVQYYCIEKLVETNKNRYFITLMVIPVVLVNFHASTLVFYFIFFLPYIAEFILANMKLKQDENSKIIIEKRYFLKLIIAMMIGSIFGLCSPNGINAYTYVFKVMDAISVNFISEMQPLKILNYPSVVAFVCLYIAIIAFTKIKVRVSDAFLVFGLLIMGLNTVRYIYFFYFIASICILKALSSFIKEYNVNLQFINNKIKYLLLIGIVMCYVIYLIYRLIDNISLDYIKCDYYPVNAVKYLKQNYDIEDIRIYNHYDFGAYLELERVPAFIDARAEQFAKEFNDNINVLDDWYKVEKHSIEYADVFKKYEITHLLIHEREGISLYIGKDENWKLVYKDDSFYIYENVNYVKEQ